MAVELNDAEKAKFAEHLRDLGFDDHAKKTIDRLNAEAKAHREGKAKSDEELKRLQGDHKKLSDEVAARKAEDDKKKADDEAARKRLDDEKKSLDERLADLRKEISGQFEEATKAQKAEVKTLLKQIEERDGKLAARDQKRLRDLVRIAAEKRGILDPEIADHLDVKDIAIEDGDPDQAAIDTLVDEHAKAKPHLYRDPAARDDRGRFARPDPSRSLTSKVDAQKLNSQEYSDLEARLRSGRAS